MHHHAPSLFQGLVALAIVFGIGWCVHMALGRTRGTDDDDPGSDE